MACSSCAERHRRDHVVGRVARASSPSCSATTDGGPAVARASIADDRGLEHRPWRPAASTRSRQRSHIMPGAVLRVLELLDEAGDLLRLVAAGRRPSARTGSQTASHSDMPLMRWAPKSAEISDGRDAPHLLVVGLEEVAVEAPAVVGARCSPRASSWSFGGRTRTQRYDSTQRIASIEAEVAQRVAAA